MRFADDSRHRWDHKNKNISKIEKRKSKNESHQDEDSWYERSYPPPERSRQGRRRASNHYIERQIQTPSEPSPQRSSRIPWTMDIRLIGATGSKESAASLLQMRTVYRKDMIKQAPSPNVDQRRRLCALVITPFVTHLFTDVTHSTGSIVGRRSMKTQRSTEMHLIGATDLKGSVACRRPTLSADRKVINKLLPSLSADRAKAPGPSVITPPATRIIMYATRSITSSAARNPLLLVFAS